jgi:hypothetical protein
MYSPEDDDLPSDYPDPADSDALVEWGKDTSAPDVRALTRFTYRDLSAHQAA